MLQLPILEGSESFHDKGERDSRWPNVSINFQLNQKCRYYVSVLEKDLNN